MVVRPGSDLGQLARLLTFVIIIALLWLGREILIPIALSVLLAFVLMPVVTRIQRLGVPRWLSVTITVIVSLSAVVFLSWIVSLQALDLAENLPRYRGEVREKLRTLAGESDSWLFRARRGLAEVREQVRDATASLDTEAPVVAPTPVVVTLPPDGAGPLEALAIALTAIATPLLSLGIVLVFTSFILVKREDLRDRALALAGSDRLRMTTQVIDEATQNVSRFLFAQLVINVGFGAIFTVGLLLIGVPNAILFGALVIPLRFVPIVGPWIAVALPTALATIVLDGWWPPLMTLGLFTVIELSTLYVIEPLAYGKRTGLSTPAVLLALVFWTWLWGAAGLVLAMPMTLCIAVLGRNLPSMQWLSMVLDEQPALSPAARVYQRLLALDADEALNVARASRDADGLDQTYDEVLLAALLMMEHDRHAGILSAEQLRFALDSLAEIVHTLAEENGPPAVRTTPTRVLCVPARTEADAISASMLAHLLRTRGHEAEAMTAIHLTTERIETAQRSDASVIVVCAMPPFAEPHARYVCQRLRTNDGARRVIVGVWRDALDQVAAERLRALGVAIVVTRITDAASAVGA